MYPCRLSRRSQSWRGVYQTSHVRGRERTASLRVVISHSSTRVPRPRLAALVGSTQILGPKVASRVRLRAAQVVVTQAAETAASQHGRRHRLSMRSLEPARAAPCVVIAQRVATRWRATCYLLSSSLYNNGHIWACPTGPYPIAGCSLLGRRRCPRLSQHERSSRRRVLACQQSFSSLGHTAQL